MDLTQRLRQFGAALAAKKTPAKAEWELVPIQAAAASAPSKASSQLPPIDTPKTKGKQVSIPSFSTTAKPTDAVLLKPDRRLASTDILTFRTRSSTSETIRELAVASPDLSAALNANLRLGIPEKYKLKAWNPDGSFNVDATRLAYQLVQRMDMIPDYSEGFNAVNSLRATSEALARDILLNGAMSMELVLDKSRLPTRFVPLSSTQILFYREDNFVRPIQRVAGNDFDLDQPTFFYLSLDQDLLSAYSTSPFEAAIQPVLADAEFTNDMRRVIKRSVHPRLEASIDVEELLKVVPPEIQADQELFKAYLLTVQGDIQSTVNGLQPEDALVHYSFIEMKYVEGGTGDTSNVYETLQDLVNAKLSTGAKTLPSVLGHGSGSQNVASSETLLAMKTADGMVRLKLNEMYSKAFTLAVRLFGQDVSVDFEYEAINLRPTLELEAFRSQEMSRILTLLSLGLVGDEEACIDLTGNLPPPGFKPLSGTQFSVTPAGPDQNAYSNTSTGGNGGGATQAITSKAPTSKRGGN